MLMAGGFVLVTLYLVRQNNRKTLKQEQEAPVVRKKVTVDKEFWRQLKTLLKIVIPGLKSKEFVILLCHTAFLVVRTWLSIIVAQMDGEIVKTIVTKNPRGFSWSMVKWLALGIPATYTNSMIRFLESKLSIAFRTRLVEHSYRVYMQDETYYRVGNLDSRLANADQCLTEDISKFCGLLAHLHSQLSKPMLDVLLMSLKLWFLGQERNPNASAANRLGPLGLAAIVVWVTARVLRMASPPFGKLAAEQAEREGELRYVHSRLIANGEEIAFYGGHAVEQTILEKTYLSLVKHMNTIFKARIFYTMLEGFFMKYVWSATGLVMVALPTFLIPEKTEKELASEGVSAVEETSSRTQLFITARKLLLDAADAIERMMSAYKEVTELAGYTSRVYEMITVFSDMKVHRYQKNIGSAASNLLENKGVIVEGDTISLDEVPIITPNGDVLVKSMNLECAPGMHLLITGPNGCGKSSLFRILGGLWPVYGGRLTKPRRSDLFYIPQRPYLSLGTLREQVIYPDSAADMKRKGFTDIDLLELMNHAHLGHIVTREGGWDAINDWSDVLSGGEKQRVGMARLFYHKPKYAILDECTSAVSIDVEGKMYTHAIDIGITLMTVTHRPSLWKYHKYLLQYDGEGGYKFGPLNAEHRLSLKDEKSALENDLTDVPKKQKRLKELCLLLGEDSTVLQQVVV